MKIRSNALLISAATAGLLAIGTLGFGATASAQSVTLTPTPIASATSGVAGSLNLSDSAGPTATDSAPLNATTNSSAHPVAQVLAVHALIQQLIKAAPTLTGKAIRADLKSGQTLAQIAIANSVQSDSLVSATVTAISARIGSWVQNGRLTQAQADQLTANLPAALNTLINMVNPPLTLRDANENATPAATDIGSAASLKKAMRRVNGIAATVLVTQTASATNLSAVTIVTDIHNGQTLAQIATANNADPNAIISAASTKITTQINKLVTKGKLTQAEADQLTTSLNTTLTTLMNVPDPLLGIPTRSHAGAGSSAGNPTASSTPATPIATGVGVAS